jgi:hypothetical protein
MNRGTSSSDKSWDDEGDPDACGISGGLENKPFT